MSAVGLLDTTITLGSLLFSSALFPIIADRSSPSTVSSSHTSLASRTASRFHSSSTSARSIGLPARQHLLGVEYPSVRLDTGGSQRNRSDKNQWWNSWRRSIRKNIGLFHLSAEDARGPPRGAVDRAAETVAGAPREGGVNQRVLPSLASSP